MSEEPRKDSAISSWHTAYVDFGSTAHIEKEIEVLSGKTVLMKAIIRKAKNSWLSPHPKASQKWDFRAEPKPSRRTVSKQCPKLHTT